MQGYIANLASPFFVMPGTIVVFRLPAEKYFEVES
jgi:hypothetical protein